jgi:hypothetical protein
MATHRTAVVKPDEISARDQPSACDTGFRKMLNVEMKREPKLKNTPQQAVKRAVSRLFRRRVGGWLRTAGVAMDCRSFRSCPVRLVAHCMHAARIDSTIVEIEQRADGDCIIDCLVRVAYFVQRCHVRRTDVHGILVDLAHETQDCLLIPRKSGRLQVSKHTRNQFLAPEQFRRDRGVRFCSEWALVQTRRIRRNQLPETRR